MKKFLFRFCILIFTISSLLSFVGCETISIHTHEWELTEVKREATCLDAGSGVYECKGCGKTKVAKIEALGHLLGDELRRDGEFTYHQCERCHQEVKIGLLHTWDNGNFTFDDETDITNDNGVWSYHCTGGCGNPNCDVTKQVTGKMIRDGNGDYCYNLLVQEYNNSQIGTTERQIATSKLKAYRTLFVACEDIMDSREDYSATSSSSNSSLGCAVQEVVIYHGNNENIANYFLGKIAGESVDCQGVMSLFFMFHYFSNFLVIVL